jgi:hypothetical protein
MALALYIFFKKNQIQTGSFESELVFQSLPADTSDQFLSSSVKSAEKLHMQTQACTGEKAWYYDTGPRMTITNTRHFLSRKGFTQVLL